MSLSASNSTNASDRALTLVLCLAASGGGHLRQLIELESAWSRFNAYFVTEDTALGQSLAARAQVDFVAHYTLGQARLGHPIRMLRNALTNLKQSWRSVRARRPDVVLTTGAASMFWTCLIAKARGARVIHLESFARFHQPSKFGYLLRPFADDVIVQSAGVARRWPHARLFDPFRLIDGEPPPKQSLVFATVGATLPFKRMTDAIVTMKAAGELSERVFVQTGVGGVVPIDVEGLSQAESIPFDDLKDILRSAAIVITHGGTGSLITALQNGCRVVAVPRSFERGEIYDHHQEEIVAAFVNRGLIVRCDDVAMLGAAIEEARTMEVQMATTDPQALIEWLITTLQAEGVRRSLKLPRSAERRT